MSQNSKSDLKTVLVTGGGGFLGRYICRALKLRGYKVISFSRKNYDFLERLGIEQIQGSLNDLEALKKAVKNCDAVIHTAALAGFWGQPEKFLQTNYEGTKNLLEAMHHSHISKLVHTSSPSVVFEKSDIKNGDEGLGYCKTFLCDYPHSKMLAEKAVLQAHAEQKVCAVVLRPHLIWGPGDPHFLPRIIEKARTGKLLRIGKQKNMVDVIHVENAANAHIDALEKLSAKAKHAGKAYFIGQNEPVNLWDFIDQLLINSGEAPLSKRALPAPLAYAAGASLEWIYKRLGWFEREPAMTRFLALQLSKNHYFSHARAIEDFGYQANISTKEGLKNLRLPFLA